MTREASLGILIPTHRGAEFLKDLVDSLESSEGVDKSSIQIIVSDQSKNAEFNSDKKALLTRLNESGWNTTYLQDPNSTQSTNVNNLLRNCSSTWKWILHDDDVVFPGTIRSVQEHLTETNNSVIVLDKVDFRELPISKESFKDEKRAISHISPRKLLIQLSPYGTYLPSQTIFRDSPGIKSFYNEELQFVCDWEHFMRLVLLSNREYRLVTVLPQKIGYRLHGQAISGSVRGVILHYNEHIALSSWCLEQLAQLNTFPLTELELLVWRRQAWKYRNARLHQELISLSFRDRFKVYQSLSKPRIFDHLVLLYVLATAFLHIPLRNPIFKAGIEVFRMLRRIWWRVRRRILQVQKVLLR